MEDLSRPNGCNFSLSYVILHRQPFASTFLFTRDAPSCTLIVLCIRLPHFIFGILRVIIEGGSVAVI